MKQEKIWLSSPHMGGNEQKYIQNAFDTNWITTLGQNVTNFETNLENYLGNTVFVTALNSGTSAIHLGLILLNVKTNDTVICQTLTFSATANPILYVGATPIFIDSEPETFNMCPVALEKAIQACLQKGKKPKAIIIVHLYGMPAKIDEIAVIANHFDIPILEDCAEALGSTYKNQKCGTFGNVSILSFNGNKIITTSGGGALVTHTKKEKEKAVFLATQAKDDAPHYQHSEVGYNYRMSNVCAGIGCGQMEVLNHHIALRRANHLFYAQLFQANDVRILTEPNSDFFSNHWLSVIVLNSYEQREKYRLTFEKQNIETRPLWKPMHLQPVFKKFEYFGTSVSENLFQKGLCLPSGSNLSNAEKERISNLIKNLFDK